jgi:hypothetical protein
MIQALQAQKKSQGEGGLEAERGGDRNFISEGPEE